MGAELAREAAWQPTRFSRSYAHQICLSRTCGSKACSRDGLIADLSLPAVHPSDQFEQDLWEQSLLAMGPDSRPGSPGRTPIPLWEIAREGGGTFSIDAKQTHRNREQARLPQVIRVSMSLVFTTGCCQWSANRSSQKTAALGSSYIGSNVGAGEGCGLFVSGVFHLLLVISPPESCSKNSGIG